MQADTLPHNAADGCGADGPIQGCSLTEPSEAIFGALAGDDEPVGLALSDDERAQLRALGYATDGAP